MVSNKNLALLLVITIVISLGGTLISLNKINQYEITGLATGMVNVSISSAAACNIDTNVSFGSGSPTSTLILSTWNDTGGTVMGFNNCSDSTPSACFKGMQINNTGNTYIMVNFSSNVNASGLLGDSSNFSSFLYNISNGTHKGNQAPGCNGGSATLGTGWTYINSSNTSIVCSNLSYINGGDIVSIGFNITVNETTPKTGMRNATITINCGQA
jgi:hypothetical protein